MSKNNKCDSCGGSKEFNPAIQKLQCKKCGAVEDFEQTSEFSYHAFDMNANVVEPEFNPEIQSYHCSNCGAIFKVDNISISDTCEYCGANLVVDFSLSKASEPDGCIPFAFDEKSAVDRFKIGLKKKWFLPNKFKKSLPSSKIESVYIPAYVVNVNSENSYVGRVYNTYRDSDGDSHRDYRKISGHTDVMTRDILIECSSKINQLTLDNIRPFDINQMKKYTSEYLMGYSVEYYDKKLEDAKSLIKQTVEHDVRKAILRRYNYDGVDYLTINTTYKSSDYARVLLPTYSVAYKYKDKEYNTFMNGQTGKVGGNLPRSKWKIFSFVTAIVAAVIAFVILICK